MEQLTEFQSLSPENILCMAPRVRGRLSLGGWLRIKGLAQLVLSPPSSQSEHPATADGQVTVTPASIYCQAVLFALRLRGHGVCDLLLKAEILSAQSCCVLIHSSTFPLPSSAWFFGVLTAIRLWGCDQ